MEDELLLAELTKRIVAHSEYFNRMLELIPPYAYFSQNTQTINNKYIFKKGGVQSYKIKNKEKLMAKFDPENLSTVPKILEEKNKKSDKEDDEDDVPENGKKSNTEIVPGFVDSDIITEREELRKRLREKLNSLRAKRNAPPLSDDPESKISEPPQKRRKIDDRRKEKQKKKENKPKQGTPANKPPAKNQAQSVKNADDGTNVEYATFDFSSGAPVPTYLQNKRKQSKTFLLKQIQENKKKLHELQGTDEGEALAKNQAWEIMRKRAQGEKVKNDPEKLKKSIKRDQRQKKKSKKEWDQRLGTQKRSQIAAQKKRQENIDKVKERKRNKRLGISKKKSSKSQKRGFDGEKKNNK